MRLLAPRHIESPALRIPRLSRAAVERARFASAIATSGLDQTIARRLERILGQAVTSHGLSVGAIDLGSDAFCLTATEGDLPFVATIDAGVALALAAAALRAGPPDRPRRATLAEEGALLLIAASLLSDGRVEAIERTASRADLAWRLEVAERAGTIAFAVADLAAAARRASRAWRIEGARVAAAGEIPVILPVVVARFAIARETLARLRIADVVLAGGPPALTLGGMACRRSAEESGCVRIEGPRARGGKSMETDNEGGGTTAPDGMALDLGEVELVLELGRATLPAREALSLVVGSIVALDRPVDRPVELRAGGRLIARGELVEIDGEAGVRVTELCRERDAG